MYHNNMYLGALVRSEMTLNYHVIVERYLFLNGVVGTLIPDVKLSLCLMEKN